MTAQIPDRIRYKGHLHHLKSDPLEDWFSQQHERPEFFSYGCSALRNGYSAMWSIKRGKLYLWWVDSIGLPDDARGDSIKNTRRVVMAHLFPNHIAPVFAEWFSGELVLESGRALGEQESPWCYAWERQLVLNVRNGLVDF